MFYEQLSQMVELFFSFRGSYSMENFGYGSSFLESYVSLISDPGIDPKWIQLDNNP